jgi:hypothetical protein
MLEIQVVAVFHQGKLETKYWRAVHDHSVSFVLRLGVPDTVVVIIAGPLTVIVMGVPAFFKWLSRRYPKVIADVVDDGQVREANQDMDKLGETGTLSWERLVVLNSNTDMSGWNPNGQHDNLYLDMNGVIHPCSHPEDGPAPPSEDAMLLQVCKYVDVLVSLVRPQKILYLAIGVWDFDERVCFPRSDGADFYRWRCSACQNESAAFSTLPSR